MGLSPRVRGNHWQRIVFAVSLGSIPAGAGEPNPSSRREALPWVYPRGCGGTCLGPPYSGSSSGLSPRVRGNLHQCGEDADSQGSIPAGAGEPNTTGASPSTAWVYPRGCGGTQYLVLPSTTKHGLSPRVRGNRRWRYTMATPRRSIPAGAGEPRRSWRRWGRNGVYPRGCGGTRRTRSTSGASCGLSPRVRGNPSTGVPCSLLEGSIPAGAGEPHPGERGGVPGPVYPRGCGGTRCANREGMSVTGLSPRVRGNLHPARPRRRGPGSIPAGAGEPYDAARLAPVSPVYPRGCGGTVGLEQVEVSGRGLSPRVRGNPQGLRPAGVRHRSIPAGAGEPRAWSGRRAPTRVYPRGCGGTGMMEGPKTRAEGLSPRVRGNLSLRELVTENERSIPAGAGEPHGALMSSARHEVYPRGCGGTDVHDRCCDCGAGLSPRVRGNPRALGAASFPVRSIPAGAGEPMNGRVTLHMAWVYPRGCGGTSYMAVDELYPRGLSPRVRGNRNGGNWSRTRARSIPAGAGEPH